MYDFIALVNKSDLYNISSEPRGDAFVFSSNFSVSKLMSDCLS